MALSVSSFREHTPEFMRLYPLEGEIRSGVGDGRAEQQDVETKDMADELAAIHSLDSLCKKVQDTHTQACNSKYGNADKSLAQLSDKRLSKNPELYPELTDLKARIRDHQTLDAGEFAEYKHWSKQLYRDTLRNFLGVVVTTPVSASPLLV
ncbi:Ff.00g090000.m01.CDS01 [Fusarium sp. VM40]|nr:Ff.00g090000.m01.CDS01 [Fusarium sp. VM40]